METRQEQEWGMLLQEEAACCRASRESLLIPDAGCIAVSNLNGTRPLLCAIDDNNVLANYTKTTTKIPMNKGTQTR